MRELASLGISPAPWRVGVGDSSQLIYDRNDAYFAFLYSARDIAANARLIASAPMLYEALRGLVKVTLDTYWDRYWRGCEVAKERVNEAVENAKAALAAASGESEVTK